MITQSALARRLVPLSSPWLICLLLCEVRALAAAAELHTAGKRGTRGPASVLFISGRLSFFLGKRESMGICFVGKRRFRDFIRSYLPPQVDHNVIQ